MAIPRLNITASMVEDINLFDGLDPDTITTLVDELAQVRVEVGDDVVEEGGERQEMFVIIHGELEVVKRGPRGGEARVALFGPGDWFGEMSILEVSPRSATVRSVAPTLLLRITPDDMAKLGEANPVAHSQLILNIARELSRRLRVADGIIAQFVSTVSDIYPGA